LNLYSCVFILTGYPVIFSIQPDTGYKKRSGLFKTAGASLISNIDCEKFLTILVRALDVLSIKTYTALTILAFCLDRTGQEMGQCWKKES
jgi:hypothetical protein